MEVLELDSFKNFEYLLTQQFKNKMSSKMTPQKAWSFFMTIEMTNQFLPSRKTVPELIFGLDKSLVDTLLKGEKEEVKDEIIRNVDKYFAHNSMIFTGEEEPLNEYNRALLFCAGANAGLTGSFMNNFLLSLTEEEATWCRWNRDELKQKASHFLLNFRKFYHGLYFTTYKMLLLLKKLEMTPLPIDKKKLQSLRTQLISGTYAVAVNEHVYLNSNNVTIGLDDELMKIIDERVNSDTRNVEDALKYPSKYTDTILSTELLKILKDASIIDTRLTGLDKFKALEEKVQIEFIGKLVLLLEENPKFDPIYTKYILCSIQKIGDQYGSLSELIGKVQGDGFIVLPRYMLMETKPTDENVLTGTRDKSLTRDRDFVNNLIRSEYFNVLFKGKLINSHITTSESDIESIINSGGTAIDIIIHKAYIETSMIMGLFSPNYVEIIIVVNYEKKTIDISYVFTKVNQLIYLEQTAIRVKNTKVDFDVRYGYLNQEGASYSNGYITRHLLWLLDCFIENGVRADTISEVTSLFKSKDLVQYINSNYPLQVEV